MKLSNDERIKLVREFQAGNENAFEILYKDCHSMIKWCLKKYRPIILKYDLLFEDVEQEICIAFISGLKNFPSDYTNFDSYIFEYIRGGALNYFKHNTNRKNKSDASQGDIIITSLNESYGGEEDELTFIDSLEDEKALQEMEDSLGKIDREIEIRNLKSIIIKTIPDINIDLLFDFYGISGHYYTLNHLCKKYNVPLKQLLTYERMIVLILQTDSKFSEKIKHYLTNIAINFDCDSKFYKSSINFANIEHVLRQEKITPISNSFHVRFSKDGKNLMRYAREKQAFDFI